MTEAWLAEKIAEFGGVVVLLAEPEKAMGPPVSLEDEELLCGFLPKTEPRSGTLPEVEDSSSFPFSSPPVDPLKHRFPMGKSQEVDLASHPLKVAEVNISSVASMALLLCLGKCP